MSDCFGEKVLTRDFLSSGAPHTAGGRPIRLAVTAAGATTSGAESHSVTTVPPPDSAGPGAGAGGVGRRRPRGPDRPVPRPDRGDGPHRAATAPTRPTAADGWVRFARRIDGAGMALRGARRRRPQPARRPGLRPLRRRRRRGRRPLPEPGGQRLPPRLRAGGAVLRGADGARPVRGPQRLPQLRGPRRPPGRARLPRRRPGPGPVRAGRPGRPGRRAWSTVPAASSTSPPRWPSCWACRTGPGRGLNGLHRADAYLARQDGDPLSDLLVPGERAPPRGRLPDGRVQPQHALPAGRSRAGPPTWPA